MASASPRVILCMAGYEKGHEFLREARRQGWHVILVTVTSLEHAGWPRESIDELFCMPDGYSVDDLIRGVSYLARMRDITRIVALDDYDVETAGALREHMRMPGMGASASRLFRDKLAMRVSADQAGILVPEFVHVLNHDRVREYTERVPPPWVLKPRSHASTIGITRIGSAEELWRRVDELGDQQSFHLLERYLPGDVYHVDSITTGGEVVFAEAHQYGRPPFDVFHEGGIAMTRTLPRESEDAWALQELNRRVLRALGMVRGASHLEAIKAHDDGRFYFLEVAARVGGANTAEMVEAATGINLWREWARLETAPDGQEYQLPERRTDYAGVIVTLARQEQPDTSAYEDPEIVYRMVKRHHVGFVLASPEQPRVQALLDDYSRRFANDYMAVLPPLTDKPPVQP